MTSSSINVLYRKEVDNMELIRCTHCNHSYSLQGKGVKTWWNDNGSCSVKLCMCPKCKQINIIKYETYWIEDINNDERLFY